MLRNLAPVSRWSPEPVKAGAERWVGVACAALLHVVAIGALLQYQPVREALTSMAPIMVDLITPPRLEVPPPPPDPPKPKPRRVEKPQPVPVIEKPIEPPPIITAPIEAPTTFIAPPPPPPEPPAPVVVAPQVEPAPPPPAPPLVPPRFNADYLQNPVPAYPPLARRLGEQGRVMLRVLVSMQGLPEKVELRTSSGSPRLDRSALETVKRWKFVPARQGDQPIAAWVLVPISFTLES